MRILVTGDRNWRNATRIRECLLEVVAQHCLHYENLTLIEGEAMGADIISAVVVELYMPGASIERYPADWNTHGRSAGPIRNRQMLRAQPDFVIGFHNDISSSRGTKDMLRQCAREGIPGRLFTETEEVEEWQSLVV